MCTHFFLLDAYEDCVMGTVECLIAGYKGVQYPDESQSIYKIADDPLQRLFSEEKIRNNVRHKLLYLASQQRFAKKEKVGAA